MGKVKLTAEGSLSDTLSELFAILQINRVSRRAFMKLLDLIPENELKEAVLSEYEKRLVLYKLTDERFKKKYSISFEEFETKNVVKEKDFTWDVEKDAMEWEHAVEGMRNLQEKIKKLKEADV